ncbi:hypothetical protein A3J33_04265 [candidate division WWE3 bacterium RIFCSPLOWO2_02_FULL_53_10]|uniref:Uncharacterized protein n=1 Tax=candidate division WWE3 bacterium RIFCSPLOWO2_02_FULL_53_10 TaxID=1802629 RepID=A0A1F4WLL8_UNCKA|nr:MAG: hypothetical protein A3J33_04265 [candidate division WWE3 bacterium RIFCSPLOWO2_02_FULL_53_10]
MNVKKFLALISGFVALLTLGFALYSLLGTSPSLAKSEGFDEFGYNRTARNFVGTGGSWCDAKGLGWDCLGIYSPDKLVMKWNAEWDRGNEEGWTDTYYGAWENNEWNGMVSGGSGETWHYKIVWVGPCGADGTELPEGGYCIWGQFAVISSHGTAGGEHIWDTLAKPAGYGAY